MSDASVAVAEYRRRVVRRYSGRNGRRGVVEAHLPPPPARVLEVGCGQGELALRIAANGYDVTAIDPVAPEGDIFRAIALEDLHDPERFDAALADRALHHVAELAAGVNKIAELLVPSGRLLVREHAYDRFDEATANWYEQRRSAPAPPSSRTPHARLAEWRAAHAGLHGYAALRAQLDRRFSQRFFAWTPYLYTELGGPDVEREEQALIDAGAIQAMGFVYVGEKRGR